MLDCMPATEKGIERTKGYEALRVVVTGALSRSGPNASPCYIIIYTILYMVLTYNFAILDSIIFIILEKLIMWMASVLVPRVNSIM